MENLIFAEDGTAILTRETADGGLALRPAPEDFDAAAFRERVRRERGRGHLHTNPAGYDPGCPACQNPAGDGEVGNA